ncbi:MAG: glutaredoxin family protein [Pseudonocardiaceae bacterium]
MIRVTLLTQGECGMCDQAKDVLRRVSEDYPLEITEIGINTDQGQELVARHGMLFAPGVLIDAEPFSYGRLSERKLRRHVQCRPDRSLR